MKKTNDIYLGLPPEKAYLEYTLRIWKKSNIIMKKYPEITNEEINLLANEMNNLEKITFESNDLQEKIPQLNKAKKIFNEFRTSLENKQTNSEELKNKLEPLYGCFF